MNSNDMSKFLRWSVPGWVAILSALIFISLDIISTPNQKVHIYPSLIALLNQIGSEDGLANIFIIALGGFPLGFLIYQFYFFIRWNSPFSKNGFFPPFIVGREADLNRIVRDISKEKFAYNHTSWRQNWINNDAYDSDHGFRWQYIESLLTEIIQKLDAKYSGDRLYDRYRYLMEMSHTLGASLGGVYVGFLGFLIVKMRSESLPITWYVVSLSFIMIFLLLLLAWEDRFRHQRQGLETVPEGQSMPTTVFSMTIFGIKISINHPSILFLIALGMFIFFVSPTLLANKNIAFNSDYLGRFSLIIPLVIGLRKWSGTKEEKNGVWFFLIISGLFSVNFPRKNGQPVKGTI